ncbi:SOS response-associated peptidase family protein, partial [Pseudomonas viridiflava]|uniref:SOS response-associated peptidase family protein n=1 Tax=Pseudomonas viridiflava TaxID=33069 RepID=UPI0019D0584F
IRLKSHKPMFFAALAQVHAELKPHEGDGFVIITAESDSGMVDIHDRRPVVLAAKDALEWIDQGLSAARAEIIAREACRPAEDFEWYEVGTAVGNVHNNGRELITPVKPTASTR